MEGNRSLSALVEPIMVGTADVNRTLPRQVDIAAYESRGTRACRLH